MPLRLALVLGALALVAIAVRASVGASEDAATLNDACKTPALPSGCIYLKGKAACTQWAGCGWDVADGCAELPQCNRRVLCGMLDLVWRAAQPRLPGCQRGIVAQCNASSLDVFNTLNLGPRCALTHSLPELPRVRRELKAHKKSTQSPAAHHDNATTASPSKHHKKTKSPAHAKATRSPTAGGGGTTIYVSPAGKDTNAGTSEASPVQTLAVALGKAVAASPDAPHIVLLAGTHRLLTTVPIGVENLRLEGREGAVVSGATALAGLQWKTYGNNMVYADIPAAQAVGLDVLSALFVNGQPAIRARYPNKNDFLLNTFVPRNITSWQYRSTVPGLTNVIKKTIDPKQPTYGFYTSATGGSCEGVFTPDTGFFCNPQAPAQGGCAYSIPSGVTISAQAQNLTGLSTWASRKGGYFHTFHTRLWGLWTFELAAGASGGAPLSFVTGGFQEARGDCRNGGRDWFVENVLELLDAPNEFYFQPARGTALARLYWANTTAISKYDVFEMTVNRVLVRVQGTAVEPVRGFSLSGVTVQHTYATHMDGFEMPSGGDWTIEKQAAIVLDGVENASVADCWFRYTGGHGLALLNHARFVAVERNEFFATASSGLIIVGDARLTSATPWDMTNNPNVPSQVTVRNNLGTHIGLVVKQCALVFITMAANVSAIDNVCYTGSRSAIALNDQFGGGHVIQGNVLFNLVLETADQGAIKVWNRQYWFQPRNPVPTILIQGNYVLGTENSTASAQANDPKPGTGLGIDLDDGCSGFVVIGNVVLFASIKLKGDTIATLFNLVVFPQLSGFNSYGCWYVQGTTAHPAQYSATYSTCVSKHEALSFGSDWTGGNQVCTSPNWRSNHNTYFANAWRGCQQTVQPFNVWQSSENQDSNSTITYALPDSALVVLWAKQKLGLE